MKTASYSILATVLGACALWAGAVFPAHADEKPFPGRLIVGDTLAKRNVCRTETRTTRLIPIIAVLGANDDGSRALGEMVEGNLVPKAPYLRPSVTGTNLIAGKPSKNYIEEWVTVTNRILANSDAPFRLDTDIVYVEEKNSAINSLADGQAIDKFFAEKRASADVSSPYHNRMIFFFGWGQEAAPFGGGASDMRSPMVRMPGVVQGGTQLNGVPVPGWYMMAHEMGHYLGLQHSFPDGPLSILEKVALGFQLDKAEKEKDGSWDLDWSGKAAANGIANYKPAAPNATTKENVEKYLNEYPYDFNQDAYEVKENDVAIAKAVNDTGIDLGLGLAAYVGKSPCDEVSDISLGPLTGLNNAVNRINPMSYSVCPAENMRFSPGQLVVMSETLKRESHKGLVYEKTTPITVCQKLDWKVGPGMLKPGDAVMRKLRQAPPELRHRVPGQ